MKVELPTNWCPIDEGPYEYAKLLAESFDLELPNPSYEEELSREICHTHILYGYQVKAIAYCQDDVNEILYETNIPGKPYAVVHLTWTKEKLPDFPHAVLYRSFEGFKKKESG